MNSNINLLSEKKQTQSSVLRSINTVRLLSVGLLFLVSVSAMILFFLIAISPLPELDRQEANAQHTLSNSRLLLEKMSFLQERLDSLSTLLARRAPVDNIYASVLSKLPNGVSLSGFVLREQQVEIRVSSTSLSALDLFIATLVSAAEENNEFSQVVLKNVSRNDETNLFVATITMNVL